MTDKDSPTRQVLLILGMTLVVAVPIALTLATVRVPVAEATAAENPTPYGYTVSLLIFLVPVLAIAAWHARSGNTYDRRAFFWTAALMAGLGAMLDLFFGYAFFEFPNTGATLGLRVPAWSWSELAWVPDYLPVEEFAFYIFGAVYMVAMYLWADLNWLGRYDPEGHHDAGRAALPRVIEPSPHAFGVWVVLLAAGILYRYAADGGFPGYYVFLMGAGVLPSLFLVRAVKNFVNWRALAFAFTSLVLVSIVWEATLALPYWWWTYRPEEMLGIYIRAWGNMPVEEVSLWLVGVWDAVMFYELFRILLRMENRSARHRLFGA